MELFSLLFRLIFSNFVLINGVSDTECCYKKENDGIRYVFVTEEDTTKFNCTSNCVYAKDSEPESRYCFENSGSIPSTCLNKQSPVKTQFIREEGNETITQENHFHEDTGILMMTVPPHKHYNESVFMLHKHSNTQTLKTGGICQISDLPDHYNLHEMAQQFEKQSRLRNPVVREADMKVAYTMKAKVGYMGAKERAELHRDVQHLCKDQPIVKTHDVHVDKEVWERFDRGEIVFLEDKKSSRDGDTCVLKTANTKLGPHACGASFVNPDPSAHIPGFSTHQISSGVINVTCNERKPTNCQGNQMYCWCDEITDIVILTKCAVVPNFVWSSIKLSDNTDLLQMMNFLTLDEGQAVKILPTKVDNIDYKAVEVVMNSHGKGWWHEDPRYDEYTGVLENNWMMKIGETCYISTLPEHLYPVDWAIDIGLIRKSNPQTTQADEEKKYAILVENGVFDSTKFTQLFPTIQEACKDATIQTFEQYSNIHDYEIAKDDWNELNDGKTISIMINWEQIKVKKAEENAKSGSWRYPNSHGPHLNQGGKLWFNQLVIPVSKVP